MKRIAIGIAALVCVVGMVYGATLQTAGNQEASKMGNSTLVTIMNANDVALNAELANAVTNVTGLSAFATNIVSVAPVTNVTAALQTVSLTDTNGVTALCVTNVTLTIQRGAAATLQTATPAVQRR